MIRSKSTCRSSRGRCWSTDARTRTLTLEEAVAADHDPRPADAHLRPAGRLSRRACSDLYFKRNHTLAEATLVQSQRPLDFEPGSKWAYCNAGIDTLGRIIEVVCGQSYEDFLREARLRAARHERHHVLSRRRSSSPAWPACTARRTASSSFADYALIGPTKDAQASRSPPAACSPPAATWRSSTRSCCNRRLADGEAILSPKTASNR